MDSTLVSSSNTFSQINELIGHLIWPILILILFFMFKDKISALFSSLRKLRFSDIEAEFDEREKSFAEQEVSPLNDEIDGLVKRIEKLEAESAGNVSAGINHMQQENDDKIKSRIIDALEDGQYRWRSIPKLASLSGSSEEQIISILRDENNVVLSKGKSGRKIARLNYR